MTETGGGGEKDMAVNRYIQAVALCNNLALLASQGTKTIFIQRVGLLTKLQKGWTNGLTLEIICSDPDGASFLEQIDVTASGLENMETVMTMDVKPDPDINPFGSTAPIYLEEADDDTITEPWQPPSDIEDESNEKVEEKVTEKSSSATRRSSARNQQKLKKIMTSSVAKAKANLSNSSNHQQQQSQQQKPKAANAKEGVKTYGHVVSSLRSEEIWNREFLISDQCSICGKKFQDLQNFSHHMVLHAKEEKRKREKEKIKIEDEYDADNQGVEAPAEYICSFCNKKFEYWKDIETHIESHVTQNAEAIQEVEIAELKLTEENEENREHGVKKPYQKKTMFSCPFCDERSKYWRIMKKHIEIHTGASTTSSTARYNKDCVCSVCGKSFKCASWLRRHMLSHNPEEKQKDQAMWEHACFICNKKFRYQSQLTFHLAIHTDERPFMCTYCGMQFKRKIHLSEHVRIHTNEKRFHCNVCGKQFVQRSSMQSHIRQVHTQDKPHLCSHCGKGFISAALLKYHIRTHTDEKPYVCSVCNKGFTRYRNARLHMVVHSEGGNYSCTECSKTFKHLHSLQRHLKLHSEGKPSHRCQKCNKSFWRLYSLKVHMKSHSMMTEQIC